MSRPSKPTRRPESAQADDGRDGRRTKLTREIQDQIVSLIRLGNFRHHAALAAGIHEQTLKNWMRWGQLENARQPYKDFAEAVLAAEGAAITTNVLHVQVAAREDWKAAAWFLARKAPEDWGDKAKKTVKEYLESILQVVEDVLGKEQAGRVYDAIASRASDEKIEGAPTGGELH